MCTTARMTYIPRNGYQFRRGYLYFKLRDRDGSIIGAVIRHNLYRPDGFWYGQTYRVYAEPGYRTEAVIQQAESRLACIGVQYDTTDPNNQTFIEWGNELPTAQFVKTYPNSLRETPLMHLVSRRWFPAHDYAI